MDRKRRLNRIFYLCRQIGLDRSDRMDLARELFNIPEGITSYKDLDDDDLSDIDLILTSYKVIQEIKVANGRAEVEAKVMLKKLDEARSTGKYLSDDEAEKLIESEEAEEATTTPNTEENVQENESSETS